MFGKSYSFFNEKKKKRSSLDIVKDILYAVTEGCKKTHILYVARLNHLLLEKYLNILLNNRLLNCIDDSFYMVSPKGENFLRIYEDYLEQCKKIDTKIQDVYKQKLLLKSMFSKKFVETPNSVQVK